MLQPSGQYSRSSSTASLKWWASYAAVTSGIAFLALAMTSPFILHDIARMEGELNNERLLFSKLSNTLWHELMVQDRRMRRVRAVSGDNSSSSSSEDEEDREVKSKKERRLIKDGEKDDTESKKPNSCPVGPPGTPGIPGMRGEDGLPGDPGKPGPEGRYASPKTGPCAPCPVGPPGHPGYKGSRGVRGPIGKKGTTGAPGRDGTNGEQGANGNAGPPGEPGIDGKLGTPGKDGTIFAKGAPGPKGETGTAGPEGDVGPPGERGDDAEPGPHGPQGPPGQPGLPGKDGKKGERGKSGNEGSDGEYCPCPPRSIQPNNVTKVPETNERSSERINTWKGEANLSTAGKTTSNEDFESSQKPTISVGGLELEIFDDKDHGAADDSDGKTRTPAKTNGAGKTEDQETSKSLSVEELGQHTKKPLVAKISTDDSSAPASTIAIARPEVPTISAEENHTVVTDFALEVTGAPQTVAVPTMDESKMSASDSSTTKKFASRPSTRPDSNSFEVEETNTPGNSEYGGDSGETADYGSSESSIEYGSDDTDTRGGEQQKTTRSTQNIQTSKDDERLQKSKSQILSKTEKGSIIWLRTVEKSGRSGEEDFVINETLSSGTVSKSETKRPVIALGKGGSKLFSSPRDLNGTGNMPQIVMNGEDENGTEVPVHLTETNIPPSVNSLETSVNEYSNVKAPITKVVENKAAKRNGTKKELKKSKKSEDDEKLPENLEKTSKNDISSKMISEEGEEIQNTGYAEGLQLRSTEKQKKLKNSEAAKGTKLKEEENISLDSEDDGEDDFEESTTPRPELINGFESTTTEHIPLESQGYVKKKKHIIARLLRRQH